MADGVSIIICCYNSVPRLKETLLCLVAQKKVTGLLTEIIVVDNASSDNTATYAESILSASTNEIDYTIVNEPESGLSYARKRGYLIAKYNYLLYCDDDNRLDEDYVQLAYNTMQSNSKIGILGGFGEPVFESSEPAWFKHYAIDFAVGDQSTSKETLSRVAEVYGAGFVIDKAYLNVLYGSGFKSILSDRKGNQLISGGDIELCYLAPYAGFQVWYNRDLKFKHFMTTPRLNWNYMKRLYAGNGQTNVYTRAYHYIQKNKHLPGQNLTLPFWIDTLIHKIKEIRAFSSMVKPVLNEEGNRNVLMYIAMKAEAKEIWHLKKNYLDIYRLILNYTTKLKALDNHQ